MKNLKLIILDRDGVINQDSPDYIKHPDEWIPLPNSLEAIALLNQLGYSVVVATNQSGIGRGLFTVDDLHAMHKKMQHALSQLGAKVDAIFFCPHHPDEDCTCRKPSPGMFQSIARRYQLNDLQTCYAVGDSLRDLQAATALQCKTVLVLTGNGLKTKAQGALPENTLIFKDLMEFTRYLQTQAD